jgi:hypothetical protein
MRKGKSEAIILRKSGQSYNQISKALKVPKSTLHYWLKTIKLSELARKKILERVYKKSIISLIRRNKQQTVIAKNKAESIRNESKKQVPKLINNKLFLSGVSLYWAEGYKKGAEGSKWKSVDFTNSNPDMIKLMMRFFREICKIEDKNIKIQLLTHKNINQEKAVKFWSKITNLPKSQFIKSCTSISKHSKGKRNINTLAHGTVHVRINNVREFFKIIGWIDGLKNYFIN